MCQPVHKGRLVNRTGLVLFCIFKQQCPFVEGNCVQKWQSTALLRLEPEPSPSPWAGLLQVIKWTSSEASFRQVALMQRSQSSEDP